MKPIALYLFSFFGLFTFSNRTDETVRFSLKNAFLTPDIVYKTSYSDIYDEVHLRDFTRKNLDNEKVYPWFKTGYDAYKPDVARVDSLRERLNDIKIIVFGGSWCSDTKSLLPGFYKTVEQAGIAPDKIILIGVDREKHSRDGRAHRYHIEKVPTFILYYNGKEKGRIVENVQQSIETDLLRLLTR